MLECKLTENGAIFVLFSAVSPVLGHNGLGAFIFLTKVDDGIYSKHFLTFHPKLLNTAKCFAHLNGDTDTSTSGCHSYITEEKAVIME